MHSEIKVVLIHLNGDAIPPPFCTRGTRRCRPGKRIKHSIADETEHSHEPLGQLEWIWCGMDAR